MKKALFVLSCLLLQTFARAQFTTIAESDVFDEPVSGLVRLLQLKNGNTFFMLINDKNEINIHIYNAQHKEKPGTVITPDIEKPKKSRLKNIFEINGDVLIFIESNDDREPSLIRITVDGNTGAMKEQKELFNLGKVSAGNAYGIAMSSLAEPEFYVFDDIADNLYTIYIFNSLESDKNKRLQLYMYGAGNKEICRAYVKSPGDAYKYLTCNTFTIKNKNVYLLVRAYNTKSSGGDPGDAVYYLASMQSGDTSINMKQIKLPQNTDLYRTMMTYNPVTKNIAMVIVQNEKRSSYATLYFISTLTGNLSIGQPLFPQAAYNKSVELFGKKDAFNGMPGFININDDGSMDIGFQEYTSIIRTTTNYSYESDEYGNIAVSAFDKDGKEITSYLLPSKHLLPDIRGYSQGNATFLDKGNQYKSYSYEYINGKMYLFLNDLAENEENIQRGKVSKVNGVGDCDAYVFELKDNNTIPQRQYFFGTPDGKRNHIIALFDQDDYDRARNILVTLKMQLDGHDKGMQVVWMQPK